MLLRGETIFFVRSLRHYCVLIFNFSDIKRGNKIKFQELHHKYSKNLRNQRTLRYQKIIYNYRAIAHKLPMLKQGAKTINPEFI